MASENIKSVTLTPTANQVIAQGRFVTFAGNAATIQHSGNGIDAVGVAQEPSANGSSTPIPVAVLDGGKFEVQAGAAITAGARVMSNANGQAITATGGNNRVLGHALEAASAAGEFITVMLIKSAGTVT